jgi:hypothetical protein
MAVWYSLWSFGHFFPFWYVWTKKNLATLAKTNTIESGSVRSVSRRVATFFLMKCTKYNGENVPNRH